MPLETNKPDATPKRAPMRTGLRILLFSSLALNLLIGGLVGGAVLSSGWRRPPPAHVDRMVGPIIQALSRADRRAIGHAMRQNFRNPDAEGKSIKQDFMPLINALRAVPYVSDEVEKSLLAQMALQGERARFSQKLLVAQIAEMSAKEREKFTIRLISALENAPRRRGGLIIEPPQN